MSNDLNIYFSQENVQMETIYPICRELQIKTTVRYHYTSIRMFINKKDNKQHAGKNVERRESSCNVSMIVNWYSHKGKQY